MHSDFVTQTLIPLFTGALRLFDDPKPTAPELFLGHFLYIFYLPLYVVLLGARSLFVDFKGWLLPRFGRRLAEGINRTLTLVLAGFLPGWLTTFAVHLWYPEMSLEQGLLAGYGAVFAFAVLYHFLVVKSVRGLSELLGRGYWHSVPIGGFFLGLYAGLLLMSLEALLAALTFLMAPLGAAMILPFAAASFAPARLLGEGLGRCALCQEPIEVAPIGCSKCDAGYHAECWEHGEGCARKTCRTSAGQSVARG